MLPHGMQDKHAIRLNAHFKAMWLSMRYSAALRQNYSSHHSAVMWFLAWRKLKHDVIMFTLPLAFNH
jgi:hypothetical protein